MSCVLRNARIPLFFNGKSNHIFIVWQHMVLLLVMIRHYEGKRNYRLFVDWLVEAYYLRTFLQLSQHVPHFTTLQKFTERITGTVLERIISSFIIVTKIGQLLFIGIDSFLWVQSNSCFTILYGKSKTYEK
ncbi:MAG TPA: transposase [Nitrososphaeraceae archaeon]